MISKTKYERIIAIGSDIPLDYIEFSVEDELDELELKYVELVDNFSYNKINYEVYNVSDEKILNKLKLMSDKQTEFRGNWYNIIVIESKNDKCIGPEKFGLKLDKTIKKQIKDRTIKVHDLKIEIKICHLQSKLKKNKNKIDDFTKLSLGKQYKLEDLEKEIYDLERGEKIDDTRLNDNDDEIDEEICID